MATVYLGHDKREDGAEELVALKVIRDELANDETFTSMFVDEAKILARLSHPNVIQTLEYGVSGSHRFIAMELLNGRTVADAWDTIEPKAEKIELGTAAWICARVAEGLHSAHELVDEQGTPLGVIHRDVNPSNIFLSYNGDVKLIDFGLARARVRVSKSAEGIIKGKIPYLAPEQAHGRPIDRRIDIYALGTTLWELATMKRLFKRDTDIDTLKAIRDAKVPDPREENPDFPEALWKIIERALRTDRDERYASAEEMRADLDTFARATGPHAPKVGALVTRLFPGGEERMAQWLQNAASVQIPAGTMAPPAPLPIASSSMLSSDSAPDLPAPASDRPSIPAAPRSPRRTIPPLLPSEIEKLEEVEAIEAPPSLRDVPPPAETKPSVPAPPETTPSVTPSSPSVAPKKRKKKASRKDPRVTKKKRKPTTERPAATSSSELAPSPAPPEDTKRLWMWVGAAVFVLIAIAVLASR